ncbi:MAG: hypothetical protein K2H86_08330 [Muribaculaceae bacterium]|nr:hypothetical protein [Muribaculaceae bacterium]
MDSGQVRSYYFRHRKVRRRLRFGLPMSLCGLLPTNFRQWATPVEIHFI